MEDSKLNKMEENVGRSSVWASVKPFVNGGLAQVLPMSLRYSVAFFYYKPHIWLKYSERMQYRLFRGGIYTGTLLGSYELLTRKVEALNGGNLLTLYQEVGCGLTVGAITVGIDFAHAATNKNYSFRHAFSAITQLVRNEGVLALWKGVSPVIISAAIAANTGMLVSYDRSRVYLKETCGLRENDARCGAGLFSGLSFGACYTSVFYASSIIRQVKFPLWLPYAVRVLTPGRGFNFYTMLWKECAYKSPAVLVIWLALEGIRDAEESAGL